MKLKNVALVTVVCVMIFSVLGAISVFAPPPETLFPAPVEVINAPESTLEVTIPEGDSLDVSLDEPIAVVNDESDVLDVDVNNFPDSIEVNNFPDSIKVENNLDISGWLHTTQKGHQHWVAFPATPTTYGISIDTEGYREITVVFDSSISSVDFEISWELSDTYWYYAEQWTYSDEKTSTDTRYFFKTYDIQGQTLRIDFKTDDLSNGQVVSIDYYLTT